MENRVQGKATDFRTIYEQGKSVISDIQMRLVVSYSESTGLVRCTGTFDDESATADFTVSELQGLLHTEESAPEVMLKDIIPQLRLVARTFTVREIGADKGSGEPTSAEKGPRGAHGALQESEDMEKAAVKLQAEFRGHLARRDQIKGGATPAESSAGATLAEDDDGFEDDNPTEFNFADVELSIIQKGVKVETQKTNVAVVIAINGTKGFRFTASAANVSENFNTLEQNQLANLPTFIRGAKRDKYYRTLVESELGLQKQADGSLRLVWKDDFKEEEEAATKLQSLFRGLQVRTMTETEGNPVVESAEYMKDVVRQGKTLKVYVVLDDLKGRGRGLTLHVSFEGKWFQLTMANMLIMPRWKRLNEDGSVTASGDKWFRSIADEVDLKPKNNGEGFNITFVEDGHA